VLTYDLFTDVGGREINEDSAVCVENGGNYCFAVADGLGGHGRGDDASRKLTEVFAREFKETSFSDCGDFLRHAFLTAQEEILRMQREQGIKDGMLTTGVALAVAGGRCAWAHCGDSRLYMFKDGKSQIRTIDHSVPQMLALAGEIKERDIARHPDRNRLLRAVGLEWDSPRFEVSDEYGVADCQAFLLCTDGFWELVAQRAMEKCLRKTDSAESWLATLSALAEKNGRGGETDNRTAIAVVI
jgi:serine/threonine protein phosphatase PrpC